MILKSETSFKYFNFVSSFVLVASCLLVLATPLGVFAQGFVPLAPIPGLTDIQYEPNGLAAFFNNLYKFAIGMAAVLAVIMIIWGGLEYSTQDSPGSKSNGKDRILQAIFGLVLVLSPVLVFSIINPSILDLSLNLEPLDTKYDGWGDAVDAATAATAAGCTVADTGSLKKKATCTTPRDAQDFAANCSRVGGNGNVPWLNHKFEGTTEVFWSTCDMTPKSKEEPSEEDTSNNPN